MPYSRRVTDGSRTAIFATFFADLRPAVSSAATNHLEADVRRDDHPDLVSAIGVTASDAPDARTETRQTSSPNP